MATLLIAFPIFILLMWLLERQYIAEPEKQNIWMHRLPAYLVLFLSGIALAADLVTILYYFIDGQELTPGFILKFLVVLVVAALIFLYYISDLRGKLNKKSRMMWRVIALAVALASIAWGFAVLGSPYTQRLYKYDEQKLNDLMSISNEVQNFYGTRGVLPASLQEMSGINYFTPPLDPQTNSPYEYQKKSAAAYELCAEFNKPTSEVARKAAPRSAYGISWEHSAGRFCFDLLINQNLYSKPMMVR